MLTVSSENLLSFAKRFLTGRINWWAVPRKDAVTNFGNVVSVVLYRKPPFQVEMFVVPHKESSFTTHRHPDVDVIEFGLSGDADLYVNGKLSHTREDLALWLDNKVVTKPVTVDSTDWHSGEGFTTYAFLSIQEWLHGVEPSSVGLNWIGEPSSIEQAVMLNRSRV